MLKKETLPTRQSDDKTLNLHIDFTSRNSTISVYQPSALVGLTFYLLQNQPSGSYDITLPSVYQPLANSDQFYIRFTPSAECTLQYDETYLKDLRDDSLDPLLHFQILRWGETSLMITIHDR